MGKPLPWHPRIIVPATGGWQTWQTVNGAGAGASGVHDLYVVFNERPPSWRLDPKSSRRLFITTTTVLPSCPTTPLVK